MENGEYYFIYLNQHLTFIVGLSPVKNIYHIIEFFFFCFFAGTIVLCNKCNNFTVTPCVCKGISTFLQTMVKKKFFFFSFVESIMIYG